MDDERLCDCNDCNDCKWCKAFLSGDDDYEGPDYLCSRCNGGGCTKCED